MGSRTPGPTTVGFRRDLRLFLSALVAFLVFLILLLVIMLQSFLQRANESVWNNWQLVADMSVRELSRGSAPGNDAVLPTQLLFLQSRYGVAGAVVEQHHGPTVRVGIAPAAENVESIRRPIPDGTLTLVFDGSALHTMTRTFWATALISIVAAGGAMLLLLLYLPRITSPIETMLQSAAEVGERSPTIDEQHYLVESFRSAVETMKTQERELQRLYTEQKTRADDLERVSATLTRSLSSGFLAVDPEGRIVDVNSVAREILRPGVADAALANSATSTAAWMTAWRPRTGWSNRSGGVGCRRGASTPGRCARSAN